MQKSFENTGRPPEWAGSWAPWAGWIWGLRGGSVTLGFASPVTLHRAGDAGTRIVPATWLEEKGLKTTQCPQEVTAKCTKSGPPVWGASRSCAKVGSPGITGAEQRAHACMRRSRLPAGRPEAQDNQSVFLGAEGRRCVRFSRHPGGRGHRGGTVTRPLGPRPTRRRTLKVKDEVRQTVCLFALQRALLLGRQTPRSPSHTRGQRSAEL